MTGHDFLALANQLATGASEAEWRTSVSRSYYAAFHVARRLLQDLGFVVPQEEKTHAYLYFRLNNCGAPNVSAVGKELNNLRTGRNQADYDLHIPVRQASVSPRLTTAQAIIQTLDNLTPAERIQIRDTMIIYERDVLQNVTWRP
jgi:uncharacterized protein (UPF0332 family)